MPVITVNGKLFAVQSHLPLTFRDVADLAQIPGLPSMTLRMRRKRDQPTPEGRIIHPSDALLPIEGMIFNVCDTSHA